MSPVLQWRTENENLSSETILVQLLTKTRYRSNSNFEAISSNEDRILNGKFWVHETTMFKLLIILVQCMHELLTVVCIRFDKTEIIYRQKIWRNKSRIWLILFQTNAKTPLSIFPHAHAYHLWGKLSPLLRATSCPIKCFSLFSFDFALFCFVFISFHKIFISHIAGILRNDCAMPSNSSNTYTNVLLSLIFDPLTNERKKRKQKTNWIKERKRKSFSFLGTAQISYCLQFYILQH